MRDLVVVGGGPIGLATALHAARHGLDVEVRERRSGVVDKACGEGLMPGALAELAALGVEPAGRPIAGIVYLDGDHRARAAFRRGPGRGVRRTTLHAALREAVESAGVSVREGSVREVRDAGDRVLVDGEPARHVVAADGLHSPVRHALGLHRDAAGPRRYGIRSHVEIEPWSDCVEVHWAESAEAYVTPVGPRQVGVAVLGTDLAHPERLLDLFPLLRERLTGHALSRPLGAGPFGQRSIRRVAGRVLLVGDAAGYVDALTGEGLAVGLAHARVAAAAVAAGDPARYEVAWRRIGRRHDRLTRGLLAASRVPPVRRRLVGVAARLPGVFDLAVDALARPA